MAKHLLRDLDDLSRELLTMGAMVEDATRKAITALAKRDKVIAGEVISGDDAINEKENHIEEEALKILALYQPVAQDLRFIITALKVNNDLERMGDLAANISERVIMLADLEPLSLPNSFNEMVEGVESMVRDSLNALVDRDASLARHVCEVDDNVDEINRAMYVTMQDRMRENPNMIPQAVNTISISRHLERVADLATNIAEDVIFMIEGDIVRHGL